MLSILIIILYYISYLLTPSYSLQELTNALTWQKYWERVSILYNSYLCD